MDRGNTKQEILEASLDLFSVQGFEATSISQIAGAGGIRKASLYSHFESKQAILDALVKDVLDQYEEHSIFARANWDKFADTDDKQALTPDAAAQVIQGQIRYILHDPHISKARKMLEEQCEARMFFMVADAPATVQTLADKYTEVHNALMYDIARGEAGTAIRHTVKTQDQMDEEAQHNYALQHRQLELCESDLRNNALDMLQKHIKPLLDVLRSEQIPVSAFALEYDARLTAMLLNYVNQNGLSSLLQISGFFAKADLSSRADAMERLIGLMLEGAQKRIDATIKSITHVVIDYINEHISQDIGITDLSRVTGYSTGYLSRVFRQEEGVSIHEYMTTMRMNLARELLINTNMRVYEIAAHCGYDNAAYFIKVFKGNTGCTPQEFKQNNQR